MPIGAKMVTAYNWQYILQKIDNKEHKRRLEERLEKYLKAQLSTLPRTVDMELGMMERFASLQKLLSLLKDLGNQVTWSKKQRVRSPKKRNRRSKDRAPQGVGIVSTTDLDSSI